MTFENDFIHLKRKDGEVLVNTCKTFGIEWPPPKELIFEDAAFELVRYSKLNDAWAREIKTLGRGAEYTEI